jgi:hypothetical protein
VAEKMDAFGAGESEKFKIESVIIMPHKRWLGERENYQMDLRDFDLLGEHKERGDSKKRNVGILLDVNGRIMSYCLFEIDTIQEIGLADVVDRLEYPGGISPDTKFLCLHVLAVRKGHGGNKYANKLFNEVADRHGHLDIVTVSTNENINFWDHQGFYPCDETSACKIRKSTPWAKVYSYDKEAHVALFFVPEVGIVVEASGSGLCSRRVIVRFTSEGHVHDMDSEWLGKLKTSAELFVAEETGIGVRLADLIPSFSQEMLSINAKALTDVQALVDVDYSQIEYRVVAQIQEQWNEGYEKIVSGLSNLRAQKFKVGEIFKIDTNSSMLQVTPRYIGDVEVTKVYAVLDLESKGLGYTHDLLFKEEPGLELLNILEHELLDMLHDNTEVAQCQWCGNNMGDNKKFCSERCRKEYQAETEEGRGFHLLD